MPSDSSWVGPGPWRSILLSSCEGSAVSCPWGSIWFPLSSCIGSATSVSVVCSSGTCSLLSVCCWSAWTALFPFCSVPFSSWTSSAICGSAPCSSLCELCCSAGSICWSFGADSSTCVSVPWSVLSEVLSSSLLMYLDVSFTEIPLVSVATVFLETEKKFVWNY